MKDVNYIKDYDKILSDVVNLLESACRSAARSVNTVMTATYWTSCPKTDSLYLRNTIYCGQGPQLTHIWIEVIPDGNFSDSLWMIGRHIFEFERGGREMTEYGELLINGLAKDLTHRFGHGFGRSNLFQMRSFYLNDRHIVQTVSGLSPDSVDSEQPLLLHQKAQKLSSQFDLASIATKFPLPWSHTMFNCFGYQIHKLVIFISGKPCATDGR